MMTFGGICKSEPEVNEAGRHCEAVGVGCHDRQDEQQGWEEVHQHGGGGGDLAGPCQGGDDGEEQRQDVGLEPSATWRAQLHHQW